MIDRMPAFVGYVTLAVGTALLTAPRLATRPLGLEDQDAAVRAVGVSDLVLVPGLLRGSPSWPWMLARAAFDVGDAVYLRRVAPRSSSEGLVKAGAGVMLGLALVDGATALALRRS
jgi:hypothetical protein